MLHNFAKNFQKRRGFYLFKWQRLQNSTLTKQLWQQLFKAVIKASDEINEKSIVYGQAKRVLPIQPLAQASEFYVPNGNHDRIALTTNGHPDIRAWSDREFVNTKSGWESLGIASSSLLSGERVDHHLGTWTIRISGIN